VMVLAAKWRCRPAEGSKNTFTIGIGPQAAGNALAPHCCAVAGAVLVDEYRRATKPPQDPPQWPKCAGRTHLPCLGRQCREWRLLAGQPSPPVAERSRSQRDSS